MNRSHAWNLDHLICASSVITPSTYTIICMYVCIRARNMELYTYDCLKGLCLTKQVRFEIANIYSAHVESKATVRKWSERLFQKDGPTQEKAQSLLFHPILHFRMPIPSKDSILFNSMLFHQRSRPLCVLQYRLVPLSPIASPFVHGCPLSLIPYPSLPPYTRSCMLPLHVIG